MVTSNLLFWSSRKEPIHSLRGTQTLLFLKPGFRDKGALLWGKEGMWEPKVEAVTPSQALQEERIARSSSGTVTQLPDPGPFPHCALLSCVTLSTTQPMVTGVPRERPHGRKDLTSTISSDLKPRGPRAYNFRKRMFKGRNWNDWSPSYVLMPLGRDIFSFLFLLSKEGKNHPDPCI